MSYELGESGGFPTYIENKKINKQDMVVPADLELECNGASQVPVWRGRLLSVTDSLEDQ